MFQFKGLAHLRWLLVMVFWSLVSPAMTAESDSGSEIATLESQLKTIESQIGGDLSEKQALQLVKSLDEFEKKIQTIVSTLESNTAKLNGQINSLGEAVAQEPVEVKTKRQILQDEKLINEKSLAAFRLLLVQSEELSRSVKDRLNELLASRLLHKNESVWQLTLHVFDHPAEMLSYFANYLDRHHGLDAISVDEYLALVFFLVVALVLGYWLRKRILSWCLTAQWGSQFISTFFRTFVNCSARYLPYLLFWTIAAGFVHSFLSDVKPTPFVALLAYTTSVYILTLYLNQLFLYPRPPARGFFYQFPKKSAGAWGIKSLS